jgi:hypothetical protein
LYAEMTAERYCGSMELRRLVAPALRTIAGLIPGTWLTSASFNLFVNTF